MIISPIIKDHIWNNCFIIIIKGTIHIKIITLTLIFYMPPIGEIAIVIGSIGIILLVYRVMDSLFSVSLMRDH